MSLEVSFTFNAGKMQVVTIDGKEWCRTKEIGKALEYEKRTHLLDVIRAHVSGENYATHIVSTVSQALYCRVTCNLDPQTPKNKTSTFLKRDSMSCHVFMSATSC